MRLSPSLPLFTAGAMVLACGVPTVSAQNVQPIAGTGFTRDIIAESSGATPGDVTDFGWSGNGWVFVEEGAPEINHAGFPLDGLFVSSKPGYETVFQLQPYDQPNYLLDGDTFTLDTPGSYEDLRFFVPGIGGSNGNQDFMNFQATVNFTDGSSTLLEFHLDDWQGSRDYNASDRVAIIRRGGGWAASEYFGNGIFTREVDFELSETDQAKLVESIDFALADRLGVGAVSGAFLGPGSRPEITSISVDSGMLTISWESAGGQLYNLRSETDLSVPEPVSWPIFGENSDLVATPPMNTVSFPLPADSSRYFVVEEFPAPPEVIFADDFESGSGDWSTDSDGAGGTAWELGEPSGVGPAASHSPLNCFGTNLAANYGLDANVWLRSPPIDLTLAGSATLRYWEFKDIEPQFDFGSVVVLDAADDSQLAVIEATIDGVITDWQEITRAIPAAAFGHTIKLEFRFESDDFGTFAGWYLDDIEVTVP